MKKLLLLSVLSIGLAFSLSFTENKNEKEKLEIAFDSDYEQGWEDGWCEGWKDVKGQYSYCPYTPYAPYPKYSCSEGYKCGYNRGFKYGMCKAKEGSSCEK